MFGIDGPVVWLADSVEKIDADSVAHGSSTKPQPSDMLHVLSFHSKTSWVFPFDVVRRIPSDFVPVNHSRSRLARRHLAL